MSLSTGSQFGHYFILGPLGAGGMGEVYRATDTKLKREVALKVLPPAFVEDPDRLARFWREAEMLASLNHPNIAQVYDLETFDGRTAIVMELVEGLTLADRISKGPIPVDEAMGIALQVAAALEAAHAKQIVHRDLKPANVKVRADGTVKVLDFGISKPFDTGAISGGSPVMTTPAVTQTGVILGTASYMSPEQARGRSVDQRTDIWAFGCLLFEMLTGQPAFGGDDVMATLARVIDRDTDLSSVPKTLSPAVRHTIKLCLQKDPKRRIADIRDVRLALEGAFESELPLAASAQAAVRARLWPMAFVAGAVVTAAAAAWIMDFPDTPEPQPVHRSVHLVPANQVWVGNLDSRAIAISPDGSKLAYGADGGLYLRSLNELEARKIPGSDGEVPIVPVFSRDGQWLSYRSTLDQLVKRIPIDGGTPLLVGPQGADIRSWRWTDDETIHYCKASELFAVSPTGGEPTLVAEVTGYSCYYPIALPDAGLMLYMRRVDNAPETDEIVAHSTVTGDVTPLFPGRQPYYIAPYLVYVDASRGLMARRFDPETLRLSGAVSFGYNLLQTDPTAAIQFDLAANGTLIYLEGSAAPAQGSGMPLAVMDDNGDVSRLEAPWGNYRSPAVSPDGSQIALEVVGDDGADIFVYDLSGTSEIRRLTFDGENSSPVWSPDGEWIVFVSDQDGSRRLWRKRANGRGDAERLTDPAGPHSQALPAFTSDGRLAWSQGDGTGLASIDLWIMDYPDGEPELLVSAPGSQFGIAFSPDGQAMAYHSGATGSYTLIVEPYPKEGGSGQRVSEEGVNTVWPVFSRDSRHLSYQTGDNGFGIVDIDTGSLRVSNRRVLGLIGDNNERRAASMPGELALLLTVPPASTMGSDSSDTRRLIIVENWIEELKERVPAE